MTHDDIAIAFDVPAFFADVIVADQYDTDDIGTSVERFGALLRTAMEFPILLQAVCGQVVTTIPASDVAGGTILSAARGKSEAVACTDEWALDVDVNQYRTNEGPCLKAARTGQMVRVRIDVVRERLPAFTKNVAGMRSGLRVFARR